MHITHYIGRTLFPIRGILALPTHNIHKLMRDNLIRPLTRMQFIEPKEMIETPLLLYTICACGVAELILACDIRWGGEVWLGVVVDVC